MEGHERAKERPPWSGSMGNNGVYGSNSGDPLINIYCTAQCDCTC